MSTYSSQLRSPKWQKRRLEIMEKAGFKCERCEEETKELNVHHIKYRKGADVWDYTDDQLVCLCNKCHEETHEMIDHFLKIASSTDVFLFRGVFNLLKLEGFNSTEAIDYLCDMLKVYSLDELDMLQGLFKKAMLFSKKEGA